MKIVIVVQARTASTRLPGKVMLDILGKPLLYRQIERIGNCSLAGKIVVATTTEANDDAIAELCAIENISCFRGHPTDLLDRHYNAAVGCGADVCVKIPSDCPLIDPDIIDDTLRFYLLNKDKYDFVSNLHPASFPDGNDVEVMPVELLRKANEEAEKEFEREHTTPFFWDNPDKFRIGNLTWITGLNYSMSHRFTIDYYEDYLFIKRVYEELYAANPKFDLYDILDLLERKPDIYEINSMYAGVNWYRNHIGELRTVKINETRTI